MSRRISFTGSALTRMLARLSDADVRDAGPAFADRLSQWLGWTDAISLSAVLNTPPAATRSGARTPASTEASECTRVRSALAKSITDDNVLAVDRKRGAAPAPADPVDTPVDFSPYRQRYLARQQAMEAGIAPLRDRLRVALAARSSGMSRLAAVDAVMEQVLAAHAHRLLSGVPAVLEKHFERLRDAQQPDEADNTTPSGEWLNVFRKDMQDMLLAELDFRFQPIEGLLEALRMP